jgi:hypothetical protein
MEQALNSTSVAYVAGQVVKPKPGILYGLTGYNSKGSAQFILIHDAPGVPVEGAIPAVVFSVAAASSFSLDFGALGRTFSRGIVIVNSSTGPTKTIGSADCWFDAQYR